MKATRICSVEGCERGGQLRRGMCDPHYRRGKHYQRWRKHGDPNIVLPPHRVQTEWSKPEDHPRWKTDELTYRNAHDRVKLLHGPASNHPCVHCGEQAAHWAYDHEDPT